LLPLTPIASAQGPGGVTIQLSPTVGQNIGLIDPPWEDGTPPYNPALLPFGNYVSVQRHNNVFARSYMRFPLDAIPAGATVTSARLEVYVMGWPFTGTATIGAYRVTAAWNETMTWATRVGSDPAPVSTANVSSAVGWYDWDVTALVQAWRAGQPNNGVMLAAVPPADSGTVTPPGWAGEAPGRMSPDAAHAPRLIVNFTVPTVTPRPTTPAPTQPLPPEKPPKDTPVPSVAPATSTPVPTPAILPQTGAPIVEDSISRPLTFVCAAGLGMLCLVALYRGRVRRV
jgi:hypothetical protein